MHDAEEIKQLNQRLMIVHSDLFHALEIDLEECTINNNAIRGYAPCHGGDNKTGWTYYVDNGCWSCWTQQCHSDHGNDLIGLIRAIKKCSFPDAVNFASGVLSKKCIDIKSIEEKKLLKALNNDDPVEQHLEQEGYNADMLARLKPALAYANTRHFDYSLFQEIGIGYADSGKLKGRIVVPVRNLASTIVGFTARKAYDEMFGPKWMHYAFSTKFNLFNIDRAKKSIAETHTAIVAESPWDVVKFNMAGYQNAVAMFGTTIHDGQALILIHCGADRIIFPMHSDENKAGEKGNKQNQAKLEKFLLDLYTIHPEEGYKDFGDMSIEQIQKVMKEVKL